jgi:3-methylcrotonyl-CoA carboxylase alpha subunit
VRQGDEISPWYDPMIAKVIVHGPTRDVALNQLGRALADCQIAGSVTNLEFLGALARHEGFAAGEVDTGLIARDLEALTDAPGPSPAVAAMAAVAGLGLLRERRGPDPWDRLAGWRHWSDANQYVVLERDGERIERQVSSLGHGRYAVSDGTDRVVIAVDASGAGGFDVHHDGITHRVAIAESRARVTLFNAGRSFSFDLPDALGGAEAAAAGGDAVIAPMPGLVKVVTARPGQDVSQGDALIVLEAMKMEHTLTAPRDGRVAEILAGEGDQVSDGMLLVSLEPDHG